MNEWRLDTTKEARSSTTIPQDREKDDVDTDKGGE